MDNKVGVNMNNFLLLFENNKTFFFKQKKKNKQKYLSVHTGRFLLVLESNWVVYSDVRFTQVIMMLIFFSGVSWCWLPSSMLHFRMCMRTHSPSLAQTTLTFHAMFVLLNDSVSFPFNLKRMVNLHKLFLLASSWASSTKLNHWYRLRVFSCFFSSVFFSSFIRNRQVYAISSNNNNDNIISALTLMHLLVIDSLSLSPSAFSLSQFPTQLEIIAEYCLTF